jgi:hypothetical protein
MTATIYFRDQLEADFFAMRVNGDVTPVQGDFPWAVTFRPEEVM